MQFYVSFSLDDEIAIWVHMSEYECSTVKFAELMISLSWFEMFDGDGPYAESRRDSLVLLVESSMKQSQIQVYQ